MICVNNMLLDKHLATFVSLCLFYIKYLLTTKKDRKPVFTFIPVLFNTSQAF